MNATACRIGALILGGLSIACGPGESAGTSDTGGSEGGEATSIASAGTTSAESGAVSTTVADATSDPTTGAATDATDPTSTTSPGSGTTAGTATGIADDCVIHENQLDCEAAECTWIGDDQTGLCVPDLEPTGGNVCEPLGMQQCEALPQCSWDADAGACNPA
jgi:hypothetical protein